MKWQVCSLLLTARSGLLSSTKALQNMFTYLPSYLAFRLKKKKSNLSLTSRPPSSWPGQAQLICVVFFMYSTHSLTTAIQIVEFGSSNHPDSIVDLAQLRPWELTGQHHAYDTSLHWSFALGSTLIHKVTIADNIRCIMEMANSDCFLKYVSQKKADLWNPDGVSTVSHVSFFIHKK